MRWLCSFDASHATAMLHGQEVSRVLNGAGRPSCDGTTAFVLSAPVSMARIFLITTLVTLSLFAVSTAEAVGNPAESSIDEPNSDMDMFASSDKGKTDIDAAERSLFKGHRYGRYGRPYGGRFRDRYGRPYGGRFGPYNGRYGRHYRGPYGGRYGRPYGGRYGRHYRGRHGHHHRGHYARPNRANIIFFCGLPAHHPYKKTLYHRFAHFWRYNPHICHGYKHRKYRHY